MNRAIVATSLVLVGFAVGCGAPPPAEVPPQPPPVAPLPQPVVKSEPVLRTTPDAPFRAKMPDPGPKVTFVPPKIVSFALKNGVRVLLVERHELPIVSVRLALKTGAGDLAGGDPLLFSFMGAMLEQGTTKRNALQLSDEFEAIGASHGASVGYDTGGASVKSLTAKLDMALDLLSDVVLHPSFPDAEIDRLRTRWLGFAQQQKTSPGALLQSALAASVYGAAHAYGQSPIPKEPALKAITKADLKRAYTRTFVPSNVVIAVAGDVTQASIAPELEAAFGGWKGAASERAKTAVAAPLKADARRLVLVDRPGASQTQVALAQPGVPWSSPDRDAISVMNAILGGMFSSRINLNLRETHAYTYGARSSFSLRHGAGPFSAGGAIIADKTAPAIHELYTEIDAMRDREVTGDELNDAKEAIRQAMPGRFETVGAVSDALADLAIYGMPMDEYTTRPARIDAITAADVKRVAVAHLNPRTMKVIVVGDRATIEPALEVLHMGPPEVRDAYGDIVK